MNNNQLQQGDVWLEKVDRMPEKIKVIREDGILAYGEKTGHKHQLEDTNIKIYESENHMFFVEVEKPVKLKHDEHKEILINPGIWEFGQVREKDWLNNMVRPVID